MNNFRALISLFFLALAALPARGGDRIDINFAVPPNAPYFIGQPQRNIDGDEFDTVVLKIRSDWGGAARLFWATNFDPQMNEPKSVWFFIKKSAWAREYVFNLRAQNPYWTGFVRQLLVFPERGPAGFSVEGGEAVTGGLTSNLLSGWQEFWGPRGRLVIGSTINTIQSVNLFGRPVNLYLYWLIFLATAGFLAYQIYLAAGRKKKISPPALWLMAGRFAAGAVLLCWLFLEASSLYTNYLQARADWKYAGKNYRDKLVLANTGDFYPFIEFCRANIPAGAKFDQRIPPIYNDIKARYYLYPREAATAEAEYLVVYDRPVEPALAGKYRPWKTFRPQALIMRSK
ncbi:MAG: hypothetical protein JW873_05525 [Candidatus Saganbacteria bacterium]|nr:hypothetical protein [Candidatus Saganbacteria bacterium]